LLLILAKETSFLVMSHFGVRRFDAAFFFSFFFHLPSNFQRKKERKRRQIAALQRSVQTDPLPAFFGVEFVGITGKLKEAKLCGLVIP